MEELELEFECDLEEVERLQKEPSSPGCACWLWYHVDTVFWLGRRFVAAPFGNYGYSLLAHRAWASIN